MSRNGITRRSATPSARSGSARRLATAIGVVVGALVGTMVVPAAPAAAQDEACPTASHLANSGFEIDTDANLVIDGDEEGEVCIDWLDADGDFVNAALPFSDKPTGSGDDSFGQGTSENDTTPTIVNGSIPPNKSDLKHWGLTSETTASGKFLQLFWSRVQNPSGTTNMDFELNKLTCDPSATPTNCADNGKNVTPQTPVRSDGDKLITYDLSKGGTVPTISIRSWVADDSEWGPPDLLSGGTGQAAGSVNTTDLDETVTGGLGDQSAFTFGEASISFAALFPSGTGSTCGSFGSAYLKSRSSDSFSSEIKDFIAPRPVHITNCAGISTEATSTTIGGSITDTATLTDTVNATGRITFDLYDNATCSGDPVFSDTATVSGNGDYTSAQFTPSAVGDYYWIASYSGDINNAAIAGECGDDGETSSVTKDEPDISTTADASITIGGEISDTATLSGGTSDISGTITFTLYSDEDCAEVDPPLFTDTVQVDGNADYDSANFTPATVGTYYWIASYSGDDKNEPASGACGDSGETSTVDRDAPGISTTADSSVTIGDQISDTATLSGGTSDISGTITFTLYSDEDCTEVDPPLFTDTVQVDGNADYDSANFTPATVGTYYWIASYSGDDNNEPASGACGDDGETSNVNKASSSISTAQRLFPQDSATVSANGGPTPTGSVTFKLFGPGNAECSDEPVYEETVTLDGSGNAETNNTKFSVDADSDGTYRWVVNYAGDDNHDGTTSECGTETFTATVEDS